MNGNIILLNLILWPMASAVICYLSGWKKTPYGSEGSTESETEMRVRKHFRDHLVIDTERPCSYGHSCFGKRNRAAALAYHKDV